MGSVAASLAARTTSPPLMVIMEPSPKGLDPACPIKRPAWTSNASVPRAPMAGSLESRIRSASPVLTTTAFSPGRTVIAAGVVFAPVLKPLSPSVSVVLLKSIVPVVPLVVSVLGAVNARSPKLALPVTTASSVELATTSTGVLVMSRSPATMAPNPSPS